MVKIKKDSTRQRILNLELKITATTTLIDDEDYMRKLSVEEEHLVCNELLELQEKYHNLTNRYFHVEKVRMQL